MKKLLLCVAMVAFGFTMNAQTTGFNAGADLTYNTDAEAFGLMVEANYLFEVSDEFRVGPAVSYQYTFGQTVDFGFGEVDVPGAGDTTLGAAARYDVSDKFVLGADLGYYLDASSFYYRPLVGYKLGESTMVQLSYPSASGSGALALGVMFGL